MKILLCGGGTGGHITPILAIAHEIKLNKPDAYIIYVGEHGGKFGNLVKNNSTIDEVRTVYAGKFRRYHNQSWLKRLLDIKTNLLNLRDLVYVVIGLIQSFFLLGGTKPDVIFLKGGFVGLPVGLAAKLRSKPYVTHDSDAIPSLTNRIVGKWAVYNATGMPEELYPYPTAKKRFVGVPVAPEYDNVTETDKVKFRNKLDIPLDAKLLVITGGSLGAARINQAISKIIGQLFEQINDLYVIHQVGGGKNNVYKDFSNSRLIVKEFISDLYEYTGAADVVVTRSGANTVAELAVQGKAIVIIPNPELTGGHQTKNAASLSKKDAAIVVSEKDINTNPKHLADVLIKIINDPKEQRRLSVNLRKESVPDSASKIAMLLLSLVR